MLLSVNCLTATDCNAGARTNKDNLCRPVGPKATGELWYQISVEYNKEKPHSFLLSLNNPSDTPGQPNTITASHAVFKEMRGIKAPAAVVGVQMDHHKLDNLFMDATNFQV